MRLRAICIFDKPFHPVAVKPEISSERSLNTFFERSNDERLEMLEPVELTAVPDDPDQEDLAECTL
jgi:hypothetical protein